MTHPCKIGPFPMSFSRLAVWQLSVAVDAGRFGTRSDFLLANCQPWWNQWGKSRARSCDRKTSRFEDGFSNVKNQQRFKRNW